LQTETQIDRRRRRVTLTALAAVIVVFAAGEWLWLSDPLAIRWWHDLFWTAAALATALRCFAVARRPDHHSGRAWLMFGLGCLSWFFGMLVWSYHELLLGNPTPFPALSDVGFLLTAPFFVAGLLNYRHGQPGGRLTLLEMSQLGVFAASLVVAHIIVFLKPVTEQPLSALYVTTALAYPVLYMALFIQALATLWLHPPGRERRVLALIAAAIATHALTDSLYAYELLGQRYATGHALDTAWLVGFGLLFYAATVHGTGHNTRTAAVGDTEYLPRALRRAALVPFFVLGALVVLAFVFRERFNASMVAAMFPAMLALVAALGLREWARASVQQQLNATLRESEERFRRFFAASPIMVGIAHMGDGLLVDVNNAFEQVTGWSRGEAVGLSPADLQMWPSPEDRAALLDRLHAAGGALRDAEWRIRVRSGEIRDIFGSIEVIQLGGEDCLIFAAHDVTARKRAEAQMRQLSSALEQTADTVTITDRNGLIEYVNPAFTATTGFRIDEAIGKRPSLVKSGKQGSEFYRHLWQTILRGEVFSEVFVNRNKDGALYYEEKTITPLKNAAGEITHFVATGRDITERMQTQERLQFLAHHDPLTELPNRALFLDRLKQSLARARWHERLVAVLFLDLDRFKTINDTLGHDAGDRLLQELATRLNGVLRDGDTVARFGGDEFVLLLSDIAVSSDIGMIAQKVLDTLRPPFTVGENVLHVSASLGISLYPGDGEDSATLLKNADTAMYRAKDLGRNNYQFYSAEMSARAFERLTLENSLRHALERREFMLYYQPQVDVSSGRITGVEALLRWRHPDFGLVSPSDFVPLLEDTGLIGAVGDWVIESACAQLAAWHRQGRNRLRMAVNLSTRQLNDPNLARRIEHILKNHEIDAACLELELTESALVHPGVAGIELLDSLERLGVRLAIDDFGTGYSSLGYLRRLPIRTLKIDRSFVRDIPHDADDVAITRAIVTLGQSLRLALVAEGVETEAQRDFLRTLGCEVLQGFLFSRPLPAEELEPLLVTGFLH
jgi:diguanylate cyclase (GGDEF)-like protein/PAS domain S-box-containing protein